MAHPIHVLLNDFATRCFRDTGDQDYISARLCFRQALIPQFHWAALQAIEKYLKCILVLNRLRAPKSHDLSQLMAVLSADGHLSLRPTKQTRAFMAYLDTYGRHRYFESSWVVQGHELLHLDRAVWEIRRFARVLVPHAAIDPQEREARLQDELASIHQADNRHPQLYEVPGGLLEQILAEPKHPARAALVWQNGCYGRSLRKRVKYWPALRAANSPLTLRPEILDEVLKYVWLPKDVVVAYRGHKSAA